MKLSANNFLTIIKAIVMGGGFELDGITAKADGGYKKDNNDLLAQGILPTSVTYTVDSDGYPILSAAASITAVTTVPFWVPRDYDEATDELRFRVVANMAGATDTPTLTITASKEVMTAGVAAATSALTISSGGTSAALSTARTKYDVVIRGAGLKRDTLVFIKIVSGAHTTDALQVAAIGIEYRSCLVSYNETDGANPNTGTLLR